MIKNRYHKTTLGENAEVLVAQNLAYTTDATIEAFVANAPDGELGVYNVDTKALISSAGAVAAGTRVEIVIKQNGVLRRTLPILVGTDKITRNVYVAPVKQIVTLDINGAIAIGDELTLTVIELTPGDVAWQQRLTYTRIAATAVLATEITALVAEINNQNSAVNKDNDPVVGLAAVVAADNITLEAREADRIFRVAVSGKLKDILVSNTTTTKPVKGSGVQEDVAEMERLGLIFAGWHTEYTNSDYTPAEIGGPTPQNAAGGTYDMWLITRSNTEVSPTPKQKHFHVAKSFVCVGLPGAKAAMDTIFGF